MHGINEAQRGINHFKHVLLNRVLKTRMDFWTIGLVQWSTITENQNHQTFRSILVDGLVHLYTIRLCDNFLTIFRKLFSNILLTTLYFLIIKFKINIFLGRTVQWDAVQCALQYTRSKTLLLGNSIYKPYCSEVHL